MTVCSRLEHDPTTLDQKTEGSRKEGAPDVCECKERRIKLLLEIRGELVACQVKHLYNMAYKTKQTKMNS